MNYTRHTTLGKGSGTAALSLLILLLSGSCGGVQDSEKQENSNTPPTVIIDPAEPIGMAHIFLYKKADGGAVITGIRTDPNKVSNLAVREQAAAALKQLLRPGGLLVIEERIDNLPITGIDTWAFYKEDMTYPHFARGTSSLPIEITAIHFPASLRKIGKGAFTKSARLEAVSFPANSVLTEVGAEAFQETALITIEFPPTLRTLSGWVFHGAQSLKTIDLSGTAITRLEEGLFCLCKSLEQIKMPDRVKTIGEQALMSCESLTAITFPAALETIEEDAFRSCRSLKQADFSPVQSRRVSIALNAFALTAFWGALGDPGVWVRLPAGSVIDTGGGSGGFFTGVYGNQYDTGWNRLTGIVNDPAQRDRTWVKVYSGAAQLWPPIP